MKILFVEKELRIDKLGMLYISAVLKQYDHSVDMIQDSIDSVDEYLKVNDVDFIFYSVMSGEHNWYINKNKELKRKYNFKSVFGGPHFTFFSDEIDIDDDIDFIVIGQGEGVVNDIVCGKITNKIIKGHISHNINLLPEPDRTILYKYNTFGKSPMKRFIASRDCPNTCIYCFNHLSHRIFRDDKKYFYQKTSPEKMVNEIENVMNNYGLKMVYFNDDDLASDHEWLFKFLKLYNKKIKLPFCGSVRANNITERIAKLLGDSNCHFINIAIESSVRTTQKLLRRGNIKNEQIINANDWLKKNGVMVRVQNMIGLPVDNPLEDALETFEFNKILNPTDSWCSIFQPFKNTDAWKLCINKDLIDKNTDCTVFYDSTQLNIKNKIEINNLHKWWYFAVKYKFSLDFLKILLAQNLDNSVKENIQKHRWDLTAKEIYNLGDK